MFSILLATAAALTGLASAQNGSYSTDSDGTLQIDPNSVDIDLRRSWCTGQKSNCYMICGGGADADLGDAYPNECDANTLTYTCTCVNGATPNISDYMNTLPYYICTEWRDQCTAAHPDDISGQEECQSVECGTRNASMANAAAGGSSASASGSASPSSTASSTGGSSASASSSQAASTGNAAVAVGMNYGTGILMGGLLAVFGLAL